MILIDAKTTASLFHFPWFSDHNYRGNIFVKIVSRSMGGIWQNNGPYGYENTRTDADLK